MVSSVRPTKRALADRGLTLPSLEVPLHTVDDPLIRKAQSIPQEIASGGGDRIRSLSDHLWFKVKTGALRGAAGDITSPHAVRLDLRERESWWLVAAGRRRGDGSTQDFYALLEAECRRAALNSSDPISSKHLYPTEQDYQRLRLERLASEVHSWGDSIRNALGQSWTSHQVVEVNIKQFKVDVLVTSESGDAYLSFSTDTHWDSKVVAVLLNSIPGLNAEDWQVEPGQVAGLTSRTGSVIFSTIVPQPILAELVAQASKES